MKKFPIIVLGLLLVFAAVFGFCSSSPSSTSSTSQHVDEDVIVNDDILPQNRWTTSPLIPEKVEFAGEPVPLNFFDVRESLQRELIVNMNFHSSTLQYLKRVTRYFPVIEKILAENGIPDDFKYLALIESDLRNRVSPAGATGFWQFMRATAPDYGLEVNAEVDERYHFEKSTVAACKYLHDAYRVFGNWTMSAASYNMGRGGLSAQVKRQKCDDYYNLLLNEETSRYIFRIVAVKLILTDPKEYGFYVADEDKYRPIPYTEVAVNAAVPDLVEFAFKHNTNYKMLKYLNPWLRDTKLTNAKRKTYMVKIPAEGARDIVME